MPQTITATTSQVVLNRAAMGGLRRGLSSPVIVDFVLAGATGTAVLATSPRGATLSVSENSLPELKPVETDQSGLCHERGTPASSSRHGKLAIATSQTQCRVAAAARRSSQHKPPATASTARLLSHASKNKVVNAECRRQFEAELISVFISGYAR